MLVLNIIKYFLLFILIIFGVILIYSMINNQIQYKKEEKKLALVQNEFVMCNGLNLYINEQSESEHTLVFLSGGGTPSPIYDFKNLYSKLEDEYKIVVVEKKGYGFSVVDDTSRDIDTILTDTRTALKNFNINGPYILIPHSMSGLEAIYWSQKYPNEVEAIIGIDMATPELYEHLKLPSKTTLNILALAKKIGLIRLFPNLVDQLAPALANGDLSHEEEETFRALVYRKFMSKNMINEVLEVKNNAKIVDEHPVPEVSALLFVSNQEVEGYKERAWQNLQQKYADTINAKVEYLDAPHYLHDYEYEKMATIIKEYIEENL